MVFFITLLRAIGACIITNSHYTGIYPTDLIANGGLIGDVIFFAVSGYCLYNVKTSFVKWYAKRLLRCYLPVWIITSIYLILGFYNLSENGVFWWYLYPTCYHFVTSIVILYIPFYLIMYVDILKKHIPVVMVVVAAIYLLIYAFFYDSSYYHIDNVREPIIRFLFLESMLIGAWFKHTEIKVKRFFSWRSVLITMVVFFLYFMSKMFFARTSEFCEFQVVNQFLIFAVLYNVFGLFLRMNEKLEKIPPLIKKCVGFVSKITLEVYVVQYVLIDLLRPLYTFPLNWIVITSAIFASATALHYLCKLCYCFFDFAGRKMSESTL